MFWDNVEITVKAGKGGNGVVSFRTNRGEAKGGPDGGDGGRGGSVVLVADRNINTLADYARQKQFTAEPGDAGAKAKRHGKSADDLVMPVPVGTMVYEGERLLVDLAEDGVTAVVARGGRGGFGNAHFTSSVRQTPRQAEFGEPGERRDIRLELKLVADVGLVGIPSVGKSTFLARVSAAKPKIADYPFTTTVPQLGIAKVDDTSLVIADIPGLIEGAHEGKGLGDAFLRHIERTKIIIHLLDATRPDPVADYLAIRHELDSFAHQLIDKPEVVALNKIDSLDEELRQLVSDDVSGRLGKPVRMVSAVSGEGVPELLREAKQLSADFVPEPTAEAVPVFTIADLAPNALSLVPEGDGYRIQGAKIERLAAQTDWENDEGVERFWWVFDRLGGTKQLEKLGVDPDTKLAIGDQSLDWPG